ncbi:N-acetyltransferase domain-containing protein [Fusarium sp. LHS14.1]|nr:N-acetyltransferase domain-containing protein [Fusarium sp. LHS14.1]
MVVINSPELSEAQRLGEIYVSSMAENPVVVVQFPTPERRQELQAYFTISIKHSILKNPDRTLVARNDDGQILSFIQWDVIDSHIADQEAEEPNTQPKTDPTASDSVSFDSEALTWQSNYLAIAEDARVKSMGQRPYIHLVYVSTDPNHQGHGAASKLLIRLMEMAVSKRLPIWLESTLNAVSFYEKKGWMRVCKISTPAPGSPGELQEGVYEEQGMVLEAP